MKPYTPRTLTPDEERLVWLLAFIQRDLTTLRPGERLDLDDDMSRLLWLRDPAVVDAPDAPDGYAFALAKQRGEVPDLPWPDALALEVQAKLKAGVALLEAGRGWEPFTPTQVDGKLPTPDALRPYLVVQTDKTIARRYHGSYSAVMLASAVDLLVTFWPRIRHCDLPSCRRLFFVDDERRRFHDRACANLAREKKPRDYTREVANAARRDQLKKNKKQKRNTKREKKP